MPPWARHPATSYCPPTTSPASSLGANENGAPHLRQKPSGRPGSPSRARPTGASQRPQKRRLSGTDGAARTAADGSRDSMEGISTKPAPSRLRPLGRVLVVAARRPAPGDATVWSLMPADETGTDSRASADTGAATDADAASARAGAIPQTSQYPSVISPVQPG